MKTLLLTKRAPFQVYCANRLCQEGILGAVVVESGSAIRTQNLVATLTAAKFGKWLRLLGPHPWMAAQTIYNIAHNGAHYGNQGYHDARVLEDYYESYDPALTVVNFENISGGPAINWVSEYAPDLVFVLGTTLISPQMIDALRAPIINMHWGWSPKYRGEGIVSALALKGPDDLGVTVHFLDAGADSGDILFRDKPEIDAEDNFYSIGLKLTKLGTERFICAYEAFKRGELKGVKQDLSNGRLYSTAYMREHPELYRAAWRHLRKAQKSL